MQPATVPQHHAEGSIRHAEKRRVGSCAFANRIARISLNAYAQCVPASYRDAHSHDTCVATIVAHFRHHHEEFSNSSNDAASSSSSTTGECRMQVMGLGVGTKFLSHDLLTCEEDDSQNGRASYGERIRDCHAEVLARRAFIRQLLLEITALLNDNNNNNPNNDNLTYIPILERVVVKCDDEQPKKRLRYRLKDGITLHFYTSSAPCGNATIKKFVKLEKEIFDTSLGPDEWPTTIMSTMQQQTYTHEPIAAHSLRLGQFALLVKRDGSAALSTSCLIVQPDNEGVHDNNNNNHINNNSNNNDNNNKGNSNNNIDTPPSFQGARMIKSSKIWPCNMDDKWCPPSCSIPNYNKGTLHSCSDKLCRWNCLGLQGSLLMSLLEEPIYMSTLTVGRKFSRATCQRAVCCRAEGVFQSRRRIGGSSSGTNDNENNNNKNNKNEVIHDTTLKMYRLNHPILMETNVYMDETGTHDMSNVTTIGQDATFDSNLCWTWWPGKKCTKDYGYTADCLEDGLVIKYNEDDNEEDNEVLGSIAMTSISESSTLGLLQVYSEIIRCASRDMDGETAWTMDSQSKVSLSDLQRWKRHISPHHAKAKDEFLQHKVFHMWSRRGGLSDADKP
jgi:hypothetical protein